MKSALETIQECISTQSQILDLYNCGITNDSPEIQVLKECTHITTLDLRGNHLHKIAGINNLINLENLFLGNNLIQKIEGLEALVNLRHLELSMKTILFFNISIL